MRGFARLNSHLPYALPSSTCSYRRSFGMLCVMQLSAVFFGLGGVLVDGSDDAVRVNSPSASQAKAGAVELIDALDARGLIAAVVTNSLSGPARLLLESVNLLPHAIVGVDDVALPKPAPDMILRACEVTGVPPWKCWWSAIRTLTGGRRSRRGASSRAWAPEGISPSAISRKCCPSSTGQGHRTNRRGKLRRNCSRQPSENRPRRRVCAGPSPQTGACLSPAER